MTKGRRLAAWLVLAAALGLAILGQIYFYQRREYGWDGLVFHLGAALCFVVAWRLSQPALPRAAPRSPLRLAAWLRTQTIPAALLALGAFFSLIAVFLMQGRTQSDSTHDAVLIWGLGVACVGLAVLWPISWGQTFRRWKESFAAIRRDTWVEVATVGALTLLAFVLRATALDSIPYTLGGDEAWHGLLARQVLAGRLQNPFNMGYMSMPTAFYWPLSWSLWLVGDTVAGLRFPAALVGTITVPIVYLFARDLWGRRTALLSTILLATYDYHIHFSRLGANNIWDPLFVVLTLWALDRGLRGDSSKPTQRGDASHASERPEKSASLRYRYFLLAGLVMGLSMFFYTGARLLPVLAGIYAAFVWLQRRRQVTRMGVHVALLILACVTVAGPMLSYAQSHPDEWNARLNQVGIIQSGWLEREPGLTGKSTTYILTEQFLRAAGAFNYFPDRTSWYGAERPLLGFWAGAFAVLGIAWAAANWRDRRAFLVLLWFWSVIITGGMLTESPPSSQRLVMAIPTVVLLVAFGLDHSVRLVCRLLDSGRTRENVALGLLVALLAASSIHFYFVEFTPTRRYGSANGETATMMGHYLRGLHGDYQAYLFGAPRIYWRFGTMSFMAPSVEGTDVVEPLDGPPDFVDQIARAAGRGNVFLFLPERSGELAWVQQAYPDGHLREFYDWQGELRFVAYEAP